MIARSDALTNQLRTHTHNAVARPVPLCSLCRTQVAPRYQYCFACNKLISQQGAVPDNAGFGIYAVREEQTGRMMRLYKSDHADIVHTQSWDVVSALVAELLQHLHCLAIMNDCPVDSLTYVPSLSHLSHRAHPLGRILGSIVPASEQLSRLERLHLAPGAEPQTPHKTLRQGVVTVKEGKGAWGHVLIIDDTWTTGKSIGNATLALRAAGASMVSSLVVARWLDPKFSPGLIKAFRGEDSFDSRTCPWTFSGQYPSPGPHPAGGW